MGLLAHAGFFFSNFREKYCSEKLKFILSGSDQQPRQTYLCMKMAYMPLRIGSSHTYRRQIYIYRFTFVGRTLLLLLRLHFLCLSGSRALPCFDVPSSFLGFSHWHHTPSHFEKGKVPLLLYAERQACTLFISLGWAMDICLVGPTNHRLPARSRDDVSFFSLTLPCTFSYLSFFCFEFFFFRILLHYVWRSCHAREPYVGEKKFILRPEKLFQHRKFDELGLV